MRKGMEHSIWIIITIVVALATALALIMLLNTTSGRAGTNIGAIITQIGENLKALFSGAK